MRCPSFLKQVGDSLVFNLDDSEFVFYVPESYFDNTSKNPIAQVDGEYVSMIGLCNYAIIDKNGKRGQLKLFNFPTMILCKPYTIEKVKDLKLDENIDPDDYRLLRFAKDDEVISQTRVPRLVDNVELFYKLTVISAKTPTTVPYDVGWKLFMDNMDLNSSSYGLSAQLFGVLWAALCRDPKDISKPFRLSKMENMNAYKPITIKLVPKFISPYTSLTSENFDESLQSAIMMKDKEDIPFTPLEKIIMQ